MLSTSKNKIFDRVKIGWDRSSSQWQTFLVTLTENQWIHYFNLSQFEAEVKLHSSLLLHFPAGVIRASQAEKHNFAPPPSTWKICALSTFSFFMAKEKYNSYSQKKSKLNKIKKKLVTEGVPKIYATYLLS